MDQNIPVFDRASATDCRFHTSVPLLIRLLTEGDRKKNLELMK